MILPLILILIWAVFWLGYAIYILNSEKIYYKYKKSCTKTERPILYHTEMALSFIWSFSGYAALYVFLSQNI